MSEQRPLRRRCPGPGASLVPAGSHGLLAAPSHRPAATPARGAPRPGPRPAAPRSLVLVVQEVFLPQVLVDPAGSEDGCREAVLADQAQGLQGQAVSSTGWARPGGHLVTCPLPPPQVPLALPWGRTTLCRFAAAPPSPGTAAPGLPGSPSMHGWQPSGSGFPLLTTAPRVCSPARRSRRREPGAMREAQCPGLAPAHPPC